nr:MAG TPA_asm: hypothetical protein [Caudoviricetes sp.]
MLYIINCFFIYFHSRFCCFYIFYFFKTNMNIISFFIII